MNDEPLPGGGRAGASRRGDVVVRPTQPWSATVLALLRHLERCGFAYSPRVVESPNEDEEVLAYIEGDVRGRQTWDDDAMFELGQMLRGLHDATATFESPDSAHWQGDWWVRSTASDAVIGHGDPAPWNIVSRDGRPVGLLDWEFAGPVDRMQEVAHAAWLNAQLYDDDVDPPPPAERLRGLRRFVDGYELDAEERATLVNALVEVAVLSAANEAIEANVKPDTTEGPIWGITWRVRSAAWMIRKRSSIEDSLS